ncbi:hypothetical protein [Celeribacter sp.]|uniref:hypothetical protein n=1 Tax=Celeribacter sp. TaxID=1890673 RepID=UPI003A93150F
MSAYGIAGLVDGFFAGADWRLNLEDEKAQRKRQEVLDGYRADEEARIAERHGWAREQNDMQMSDLRRAQSRQQAMDDALGRAYDAANSADQATNEPLGAIPSVQTSTPDPRTPVATRPQVRPDLPISPEAGTRTGQAIAEGLKEEVTSAPERMRDGPTVQRAQRFDGNREFQSQVDMLSDLSTGRIRKDGPEMFGRWQSMSRSEREAAGLPVSEIGGQWFFRNRHNEPLDYDRDAVRTAAEAADPKGAARLAALNGDQSAVEATPPTSQGSSSQFPADAPLRSKEPALTATAKDAMAEVSTPALQAASVDFTSNLGATKGPVTTQAQREKAATSFLDRYMEKGVPIVMEEMLRQGRIEDAMAFESFLQQGEVKKGMQNWANGIFAASIGDFDTFADEMTEAYNRLDYFGDGISIDRENSGFKKDRDGNITGASIVYKDEETGNTFEQTFNSPEDMIRMGVTLLSPEEAFKYYIERQKQATELAGTLTAKADKEQAELQKRIDDLAQALIKREPALGEAAMAPEDAYRRAEQIITGGSSGVPMLTRPQQSE